MKVLFWDFPCRNFYVRTIVLNNTKPSHLEAFPLAAEPMAVIILHWAMREAALQGHGHTGVGQRARRQHDASRERRHAEMDFL